MCPAFTRELVLVLTLPRRQWARFRRRFAFGTVFPRSFGTTQRTGLAAATAAAAPVASGDAVVPGAMGVGGWLTDTVALVVTPILLEASATSWLGPSLNGTSALH